MSSFYYCPAMGAAGGGVSTGGVPIAVDVKKFLRIKLPNTSTIPNHTEYFSNDCTLCK